MEGISERDKAILNIARTLLRKGAKTIRIKAESKEKVIGILRQEFPDKKILEE